MGGKLSLYNDTTQTFNCVVRLKKGGGEKRKLQLGPGETAAIRVDNFNVARDYNIEFWLDKGEGWEEKAPKSGMRQNTDFVAWRNFGETCVSASKLISSPKDFFSDLESCFLARVLQWLRIKDRESYGVTYSKCFVANETVTNLVLHRVAKSEEEALMVCQKLMESGLFVKMMTGQIVPGLKFENKYRFFKLNTDMVNHIGSLKMQSISRKRMFQFKLHAKFAKQSNEKFELVGWLEKKGKLGFWKPRFFRVLPHRSLTSIKKIMYYSDQTSMKCVGGFSSLQIQRVSVPNPKKLVMEVHLPMNKKFTLRAPNAESFTRWREAFESFARTMSPENIVARTALSHYLKGSLLSSFSKRLRVTEVKQGEWLCRRGQASREFGIISAGSIGIFISSRDSKHEKLLCTRGRYDFVGEDIFASAPEDSRSIQALENCVIYTLKEKDCIRLFKRHPMIAQHLRRMFHTGLLKCLESTSLFGKLNILHLAKLRLAVRFVAARANRYVYERDDPAEALFVVMDGETGMIQPVYGMIQKRFLVNESFGEVCAFLPGTTRKSSIVATRNSLLLQIDTRSLENFLAITNLSKINVLHSAAVQVLHDSDFDFFDKLSDEGLRDLVRHHCEVQVFEKDHVVFEEGDVGEKFYAIIEGQVDVLIKGALVRKLGRKAYFGEISLVLQNTNRTATIRASTKTAMLTIDKKAFRKFFAKQQGLMAGGGAKDRWRAVPTPVDPVPPEGLRVLRDVPGAEGPVEGAPLLEDVLHVPLVATSIDPQPDLAAIQTRAQEIYDTYLRSSDASTIILGEDIRKDIEGDLKNQEADAGSYVAAESEMMKLMSKMHLDNFKATEWFQRLLQYINTGRSSSSSPEAAASEQQQQQQQQEEEEEEEDEKHNEKHHNNNNHINNKARKTTKKDKHLKCTPVVRRLKRQGSIIMPLTSTTSTAKVTKSGQEFINNLRQIAKDHAWGMQPCVFTSTLPRAIHTGKAFITGRGHSQQWSALNLLDTGVCHGMKVEDIKKTLPEEYGKW
eukprot:CAMPEP_0167785016 /NCGR_PEP_ID=MMETSP0111_2-20121227/8006_1 /TAXON_ID=91324 /ORGANISM="Lotharella globosa, Strain CCCM811" /LENGTH=1016 /DNA_ID=CAMNT_0007676247 /DNA_START=117 /DNA_END=3165 /DNA_ORIENTATION=+